LSTSDSEPISVFINTNAVGMQTPQHIVVSMCIKMFF
jgi:hypothetical protein